MINIIFDENLYFSTTEHSKPSSVVTKVTTKNTTAVPYQALSDGKCDGKWIECKYFELITFTD